MEQRSLRVITLQNSDAQTLAANLNAVFSEEQGKEPAPTIRVDPHEQLADRPGPTPPRWPNWTS